MIKFNSCENMKYSTVNTATTHTHDRWGAYAYEGMGLVFSGITFEIE